MISASEEARPPAEIPDHELIRRIGHGSYGEVWLARNIMGEFRAVKLIYRESFNDDRPFQREWSGIRRFEPISRSHKGYITILHVGLNEARGYFYYVMELGDDNKPGQRIEPETYSPKTLASEIARQGKLPFEQCLQLGLVLSDALAELHKKGLVHRDVKPSNIIYVNGSPKLADIGLVADVNDARTYVGTDGYIAPEGPGTAQADVFSLGKVLYEASTGRDRCDFPELPMHWEESGEHLQLLELNEVILESCEGDIARRYPSARELYADLVVLANGKSVKRLKLLERRLSHLKRVAGVIAIVLLLLAIIGYQVYREWKTAMILRHEQVGAKVAYGNRALEAGDLSGSLPYFTEALRLERANPDDALMAQLRIGCIRAQCPKLVQLWAGSKEVQTAEFSSDGQRVLRAEYYGQVQIFDVATGRPAAPAFGQPRLLQATWSPDGALVLAVAEDRTARLWRASDGAEVRVWRHPHWVQSGNFSPAGPRLVTGCEDGVARVWGTNSEKPELELVAHTQGVLFAAFSPDGKRIVTGSRDNTARIWDAATGKLIGRPLPHSSWVRWAAFNPDGRTLVTATYHKACVWDLGTGRELLPELNQADIVSSVEFSPDGQFILTACMDRTVRLWTAADHQPSSQMPILHHSDRLQQASFCRDGHRIVTGCIDGTVRIWDLAGGEVAPAPMRLVMSEDCSRYLTSTAAGLLVNDSLSHSAISPPIKTGANVEDARLSRDGAYSMTVSAASTNSNGIPLGGLEIWETATGNRVGQCLFFTNNLAGVSLSQNGKRLLLLDDQAAQVWELTTGEPLGREVWQADDADAFMLNRSIGGATNRSSATLAAWHPTAKAQYFRFGILNPSGTAAATWQAAVVRVWDASSGREHFPPLKHAFPIKHVEFSPDGSKLLTCGAEGGLNRCEARVWNAVTGAPLSPPLKHMDGVLWAAFSPDALRVATASEDFTASVWDIATGRALARGLKHEDQVASAAFSPDGRWVVTVGGGGGDRTVRVWSAEMGDPLAPPVRLPIGAADARFLADSRHIVALDAYGNVRRWTLTCDNWPISDIVAFASIITGDTPGLADKLSLSPESLEGAWQQLRAKYASAFIVSPSEVCAWHTFEAEFNEAHRQWFAAAFHLCQLISNAPPDASLLERLDRARKHLSATH